MISLARRSTSPAGALDDPYSEYYTAEELNELTEQTQGIYYGIGAYVSMDSDTNLPKISGVLYRNVQIIARALSDNRQIYRGASFSADHAHGFRQRLAKVESPTVKYEMLDDNMAYIQIVEFDDVTIDQFIARALSDNRQIYRGASFSADHAHGFRQRLARSGHSIHFIDDIVGPHIDQFTDALATVKGSDMKGLILDLRGNPGCPQWTLHPLHR